MHTKRRVFIRTSEGERDFASEIKTGTKVVSEVNSPTSRESEVFNQRSSADAKLS